MKIAYYVVYDSTKELGRFAEERDAVMSIKITWSKVERPSSVFIKEESFEILTESTHF